MSHPKRFSYWSFKNVYTPAEIKQINIDINNNILPSRRDRPAPGVKKTATVKIFPMVKVPLLERLYNCALDANFTNFGYNLYPFGSAKLANYNIYNAKQKATYGWHPDGEFENPYTDTKLTLLLNVSEQAYKGGDLWLKLSTASKVPHLNEPGSVVVFTAWHPHKVTPVITGERKTVSLWLPGPKFQ